MARAKHPHHDIDGVAVSPPIRRPLPIHGMAPDCEQAGDGSPSSSAPACSPLSPASPAPRAMLAAHPIAAAKDGKNGHRTAFQDNDHV